MYQKSKAFDQMYKFLIIGDSEVGKTNLMMRFCDDNYSETHIATIGVDFKFKEVQINDQVVKMQIWDTAGQERFRTLTQSYYKGASGIILVYAINNLSSFQNIDHWIQNVKSNAKEDIQMLLIANKCDLANSRIVSTKDGQMIADANALPFFETSAKENINVEKVFTQIASMVQKTQEAKLPQSGKQLGPPNNESKKLVDKKGPNRKKKCCD